MSRGRRWVPLLRRVTLLAALGLGACGGAAAVQKAPDLPPANPQAVNKMMQAVAAAKESDGVDRAIKLLREAIKTDPRLWEAEYDLGLLLVRTGDLTASEKHLAKAFDLAPNAEDVAVALAEVRRRLGNAKGAAEVLEPFVRANPKALTARIALVSALRESGRVDEAIVQAREVLVRRSDDPNALAELAMSHLARGEIDTAQLLAEEALKQSEGSAIAERTAGMVALKRGDDAIAFQHFAKASQLDPKDTTARLNTGTVLLQAGVYDRAGEQFQAVLEIKPNDVLAKLGLAAALRGVGTREKSGPWTEAEKLLEDVLAKEPNNFAAAFNLAVLYADFMQRPAEAKVHYENFLDNSPSDHPRRADAQKALAGMK